jgi:hypothetical protein
MLRVTLAVGYPPDEVNTMHAPLIVGIVVLALLLLALIKMLPDLVRYMKMRSM